MTDSPNVHGRSRGRGLRPWLIQLKCLGLVGFLGGLAALSALGSFGPAPVDAAGWALIRSAVRAVFWPCVFGGVLLTVAAGFLLWLQHPKVFLRMRWFRFKVALLAVALPSLHLWARGRVTGFYLAIEEERLDDLPALYDDVSQAFLVALIVLLGVSSIGRFKPRLGERVGARSASRSAPR